jgi:hypothetical protein
MLLTIQAPWSQDWQLYHKVVFDGINKLIYISPNESVISVKEDIYSSWKEWLMIRDNSKFLPAIRTIGGDPVGGGKYAGDIYFLVNGWKIVIDHAVAIDGTLYNDSGESPYIIIPGGGVTATVSNLAYAIATSNGALTEAQQLQLDKILQLVRTTLALSA